MRIKNKTTVVKAGRARFVRLINGPYNGVRFQRSAGGTGSNTLTFTAKGMTGYYLFAGCVGYWHAIK